jgi:hypothetical protein
VEDTIKDERRRRPHACVSVHAPLGAEHHTCVANDGRNGATVNNSVIGDRDV